MIRLWLALAFFGLCAVACAPVRAQAPAAIPDVATRCLLREGDDLVNCTAAIERGGLSGVLLALVYNARGEAHCH